MRASVTEAEFKAAHKMAVAWHIGAGWFTRRVWLQFLERRLGPDPRDALGRVFSELYVPLLERELTRVYGGCAKFQLAFNGPGTELVWVRRGYMPERLSSGEIYTVKAEAMFAPMPEQPEAEYYFLTPKGPAKLVQGGNIVMLTDADESWKTKLYTTTAPVSPAVPFAPVAETISRDMLRLNELQRDWFERFEDSAAPIVSEEMRDAQRRKNQLESVINEAITRGASVVDDLPTIMPSERVALQMLLERESQRREVKREEFLFNAGKEAAAAWKDLTGEEVPPETWNDIKRAEAALWKASVPPAPPVPPQADLAAIMRRALMEIVPGAGPAADRARELLAADADGTLTDDMMRQFVLEFPETAQVLRARVAELMLPPPASQGIGSLAIPRKEIYARIKVSKEQMAAAAARGQFFDETASNPRPKPEVHVTRGPRRYFDDD